MSIFTVIDPPANMLANDSEREDEGGFLKKTVNTFCLIVSLAIFDKV